jgi:putative peptidoglycan lipid II flippase
MDRSPGPLPYPGSVNDGAARVWCERYELIDLVARVGPSSLWRAYDNRLRRTVGLRTVDSSFPRLPDLQQAAIAAAHITDRRFANVLDVMGPEPDDELVIITEWIPGLALREFLDEPMTPHGAASTVAQAARAISSAHAQGVTHGRLRPSALMLLPDGSVRVRGHGVDAGLYGRDPDLEPVAADIHGIGSLLYACLTARWPFDTDVGLPVAPQENGRPIRPSRFVADIPEPLCRIIDTCWQGGYATAAEVAAELRLEAGALSDGPRRQVLPGRRSRVLVSGVVAALGTVAVVMGLADAASRSGDPVTAQPRAQGLATLVPTTAGDERKLPIVAVDDYDPLGVDGENEDLAKYALDRDPLTAWTTVTYYDPYLGGKPGVGLRIDLGAPRQVTSVDLKLVGANSDFEVLIGDKRSADPEKYRRFAEVTGAGTNILLRSARPMTGRYVVVWFTRLPWIDGGYRGGVRSIVVRSG